MRGSVKIVDGNTELRCMRQAAGNATPDDERVPLKPTCVSTEVLEVIEETPYHELFIWSFEESIP